jgi:hypothetical protein
MGKHHWGQIQPLPLVMHACTLWDGVQEGLRRPTHCRYKPLQGNSSGSNKEEGKVGLTLGKSWLRQQLHERAKEDVYRH